MSNETASIKNSSGALPLDSEFRLDTTTGLWTLIVEGRSARPSNTEGGLAINPPPLSDAPDPRCCFCVGNEKQTPEINALAVLKASSKDKTEYALDDVEFLTPRLEEEINGRQWFVRAVENRFPAFRLSACDEAPVAFDEVQKRFESQCADGNASFFNSVRGEGRHEVIIDSCRHVRSWSDFSDLEICLTFRMFRMRLNAFRASGRFAYSFVFKNVGPNAGASQRHSHCQLTGNVSLPPTIRTEIERLIAYERARKERDEEQTYWDALLAAELDAKKRIVFASERFVVYCPYASRFPMQTEICPRFATEFELYDDDLLDELALLMRKTIRALEEARRRAQPNELAPLDYNVVMRNVPTRLDADIQAGSGLTRPRWVVLPSLVKKAGYEIGCGIDINPIAPETAARLLREVFDV